jgi:RimJ/RimL family protein N-acetyltransferase
MSGLVTLVHQRSDGVRVTLADGSFAVLRPLQQGDLRTHMQVFDTLSSESRGRRYFTDSPRLPSSVLRALADVDGYRHVAWAAYVAGRPVGLARAVRVPGPGDVVVEVAFEVGDSHQGRGLGSALLDSVLTVSAALGVRRVRATVQPGNDPSVHLLQRVALHLSLDDGLLEGEAELRLPDPPRVDRASVLALADVEPCTSCDPERPLRHAS